MPPSINTSHSYEATPEAPEPIPFADTQETATHATKEEINDAIRATKYALHCWQGVICTGGKELCHSTSDAVSHKPWSSTYAVLGISFLAGVCLARHLGR